MWLRRLMIACGIGVSVGVGGIGVGVGVGVGAGICLLPGHNSQQVLGRCNWNESTIVGVV